MKLSLQNIVFGGSPRGFLAVLTVIGAFCLSACGARGEYPSLADIPNAPDEVTPMEERRAIAGDMAAYIEPEPEEAPASEDDTEEAAETSTD